MTPATFPGRAGALDRVGAVSITDRAQDNADRRGRPFGRRGGGAAYRHDDVDFESDELRRKPREAPLFASAHRPRNTTSAALTLLNRQRVIDFALVHRNPATYENSALVRDGGLMWYGANPDDKYGGGELRPSYLWSGRDDDLSPSPQECEDSRLTIAAAPGGSDDRVTPPADVVLLVILDASHDTEANESASVW